MEILSYPSKQQHKNKDIEKRILKFKKKLELMITILISFWIIDSCISFLFNYFIWTDSFFLIGRYSLIFIGCIGGIMIYIIIYLIQIKKISMYLSNYSKIHFGIENDYLIPAFIWLIVWSTICVIPKFFLYMPVFFFLPILLGSIFILISKPLIPLDYDQAYKINLNYLSQTYGKSQPVGSIYNSILVFKKKILIYFILLIISWSILSLYVSDVLFKSIPETGGGGFSPLFPLVFLCLGDAILIFVYIRLKNRINSYQREPKILFGNYKIDFTDSLFILLIIMFLLTAIFPFIYFYIAFLSFLCTILISFSIPRINTGLK